MDSENAIKIVNKFQVFEIDEIGYIKEIYVVDEGAETELITVQPPQGLHRAKWTGAEWIEGLSQEELGEIEYQRYLESLKPSKVEVKKAQMELLMLDLLVDMEVM